MNRIDQTDSRPALAFTRTFGAATLALAILLGVNASLKPVSAAEPAGQTSAQQASSNSLVPGSFYSERGTKSESSSGRFRSGFTIRK